MSRFDDAARFAVDAHSGAVRKGDGLPYVLHPFEVASIAASITTDEDVIIAALLHDTVEDARVAPETIAERFGDRVAALVSSETEDKHDELPRAESWRMRKEESLSVLEHAADDGVRALWLADKLANLRSFSRLREECGDALWERFNQSDPAQHEWYYRRVLELTSALAHTQAWRELDVRMDQVFGGVGQHGNGKQ